MRRRRLGDVQLKVPSTWKQGHWKMRFLNLGVHRNNAIPEIKGVIKTPPISRVSKYPRFQRYKAMDEYPYI